MQSVFKNCIQGQLIYNVVLISAVQQVDLYICIPSYSFPWRLTTEYWIYLFILYSQFSSVAQLCPPLWDPMDCKTPGFPVYPQLLEFSQTHIHLIGDAIQPSHPLLTSSPLAFNLSQHRGLFQWVYSSHQVSKGLELQLQYYSFQLIFRIDFL